MHAGRRALADSPPVRLSDWATGLSCSVSCVVCSVYLPYGVVAGALTCCHAPPVLGPNDLLLSAATRHGAPFFLRFGIANYTDPSQAKRFPQRSPLSELMDAKDANMKMAIACGVVRAALLQRRRFPAPGLADLRYNSAPLPLDSSA